MENLSPYRDDFREVGPAAAFERWERPARHLGYTLLDTCIDRGYSILFEHGNATPAHVDLYRRVKSLGYRIEILFIDVDPRVAASRAASRERYFPPGLLDRRHAIIQQLNETYKKIADTFNTITT